MEAIRILKPVSSAGKMKLWPKEDLCSGALAHVEASGLLPAVENSMIDHDRVFISALLERFYGETDTMHMPCGEMAITPEDAHVITKLSPEGKAVADGYDPCVDWKELNRLVFDCLGWSPDKYVEEWKKCASYRNRQLDLKSLREQFSGTAAREQKGSEISKETCRHTATAYLLYLIGCVIFPNKTGSRVDVNHLQLLEHLDKVKTYAWGTACLAFLLKEMRTASRQYTAQIGGNVAILQVILSP